MVYLVILTVISAFLMLKTIAYHNYDLISDIMVGYGRLPRASVMSFRYKIINIKLK